MKKILIVGDSYTFGQGCSDRLFYLDKDTKEFIGNANLQDARPSAFCWGSLLQQDYTNYEVVNLAKPGLDNVSILMSVRNHLVNDVALLIFASSSPERMQVADPYYPAGIVTWIMSHPNPTWTSEEGKTSLKYYLKHIYHPDALANTSISTIFAAYGLSALRNSKFIFSFDGDLKYINKHLIELKSNRIMGIVRFMGSVFKPAGRAYHAIDGHANDLGHSKYYAKIIKPMMEKLKL